MKSSNINCDSLPNPLTVAFLVYLEPLNYPVLWKETKLIGRAAARRRGAGCRLRLELEDIRSLSVCQFSLA